LSDHWFGTIGSSVLPLAQHYILHPNQPIDDMSAIAEEESGQEDVQVDPQDPFQKSFEKFKRRRALNMPEKLVLKVQTTFALLDQTFDQTLDISFF
jgi:hypothetical protein